EALVPLSADLLHPVERVAERLRAEAVADLAAGSGRLDELCRAERAEVLRHRLPRDRQCGGQLGGRRRPAPGERLENEAPVRIGEGLEDRVYATAVHAARALISKAVDHSGDDSTTTSRVPSGTGSSVKTTSPPPSSQRRVRSRSGS